MVIVDSLAPPRLEVAMDLLGWMLRWTPFLGAGTTAGSGVLRLNHDLTSLGARLGRVLEILNESTRCLQLVVKRRERRLGKVLAGHVGRS